MGGMQYFHPSFDSNFQGRKMRKNTFLGIGSRRYEWVLAILLCGAVITAARAVESQEVPHDTTFNIQQFKPSPGPLNYFQIESPELGDDMKPSVGAMLWYGRNPFVIYNCNGNDCNDNQTADTAGGDNVGTLHAVENLMTLNLMGSFNFAKYFQVGIALPLTVWQGGTGFSVENDSATGASWLAPQDDYTTIFAPSDLRIHAKARFLGKDRMDGLSLAVSANIAIPLWNLIGYGKEDSENGSYGYGGDGFISGAAPRLLLGYRIHSFRTALNVGMYWRKKAEFLNVEIGHQLEYGAAVGYTVIPQVELIAEVFGTKSVVSENFTDAESASLMIQGGGRFPIKDFTAYVSAGGGVVSGIGVPQFMIMAGGAWTPIKKEEKKETYLNPSDIDMDGIANELDKCPNSPEDTDKFEDEDGCPDLDNDKDGIPDGYDSCLNEAEDKDGFKDDDGCPDLDHDEDRVLVPDDKCPNEPEDFDEFEDKDGCPELDNDKDGLADPDDFCPDAAEDKDGFEDDDGCPDKDNDADGVQDVNDKCPNEPETLNGFKDDDGCPDRGKALVVISKNQIELTEMIQFKKDSDEIRGEQSFAILKIVVSVLIANPDLRVSVEGHTDNKGSADHNRELSKKRAESVKRYLVQNGVATDRLETVGWGPDKPIAENRTQAGREQNRRVEFIIIRPEGEEPPAAAEPAPSQGDGSAAPQGGAQDSGGGMDFTGGGGDASGGGDTGAGGDTGGGMDFTK
jgi:outer membrane protein OmpA-like peptidoglycan-associated protein